MGQGEKHLWQSNIQKKEETDLAAIKSTKETKLRPGQKRGG